MVYFSEFLYVVARVRQRDLVFRGNFVHCFSHNCFEGLGVFGTQLPM
ncbi:20866_t:CDS:2 [Gigaspora rosea]|nr:20866_t:CDS:2 [Gigaspora rosea]